MIERRDFGVNRPPRITVSGATLQLPGCSRDFPSESRVPKASIASGWNSSCLAESVLTEEIKQSRELRRSRRDSVRSEM